MNYIDTFKLKRDTPDVRDILFKAEKLKVDKIILPVSFNLQLTKLLPSVLNQGQLGSCGPNQISNCLRYCLKKLKTSPEFQPSRLYIYYFARLLDEAPLDSDTGISIRTGLKVISHYGACSEDNWGYNISKFTQKPSDSAILAGKTHIPGYKYIRVPQNLINIKQSLVGGFPIICGILLYSSFVSDNVSKTGIVPLPNTSQEECLGGHCVSIVGYNDTLKTFTLMNSWGTGWGNKGFFTLPYDYIMNNQIAFDFWIITYFK